MPLIVESFDGVDDALVQIGVGDEHKSIAEAADGCSKGNVIDGSIATKADQTLLKNHFKSNVYSPL